MKSSGPPSGSSRLWWIATIPVDVPYISADPALSQKWRERTAAVGSGLRVGIVWAGGQQHQFDRLRSLPLSLLAPLARVTGVCFFSLQVGPPAEQAKSPPHGMELLDYTGDLTDFAETAGLISNLDLVIASDTAVAHLAGAMARKTWLLLPFVPWRWLLDRDDSPWYPTMRLFRQRSPKAWESVIEEVAKELGKLAAGEGGA